MNNHTRFGEQFYIYFINGLER